MLYREYALIDAVNWSRLKKIRTSPRHFLANVDKGGDTLTFGRATHSLLLGGDPVVEYDGIRRGREWSDFQAAHAGAVILKTDAYEIAHRMARAAREHAIAGPRLALIAESEAVIQWTDRHGIACKALADAITADGDLLDIKTAADVGPAAFGRAAANYGYHLQMAWYARGYAATRGHWPERVLLIAVEKAAPHDVGVYEIEHETIRVEQRTLDELLDRVAECRRRGTWPGVTPEIMPLQLPAWALAGGDDPGPVIGGDDVGGDDE